MSVFELNSSSFDIAARLSASD